MYCSHCKKHYDEDIKICPECHEELKDLFEENESALKTEDSGVLENRNNIQEAENNQEDTEDEEMETGKRKSLAVLLFVLIVLSFGSACYFLISYQNHIKASAPVVGAMTTTEEKKEETPFEAHIEDEISPEHEKAFIKEAGHSKPGDRNPVPVKKEEEKKEEKEEKTETSFKPGVYTLNYDMNMREKGSAGSSSKGLIDAGSKVTVTEIVIDSDGTVWGHASDGYWICLKDSSLNYAKAS